MLWSNIRQSISENIMYKQKCKTPSKNVFINLIIYTLKHLLYILLILSWNEHTETVVALRTTHRPTLARFEFKLICEKRARRMPVPVSQSERRTGHRTARL